MARPLSVVKPVVTPVRVAEPPGTTRVSEQNALESGDLLHGGWYTTDDVAALIGVDTSTLRRWRTSKPPQGPPFVPLSSRVTLYSVGDVQDWLASRRVDPRQAA
nr:helix-turn-helix domain-containing protein [Streptomyces qinglanensis]